jgi:hypothetical protein
MGFLMEQGGWDEDQWYTSNENEEFSEGLIFSLYLNWYLT